ncbi:MAG: hypothetical protein ACRDMI_09405, partial [Streptosporangiaceae bacterium]
MAADAQHPLPGDGFPGGPGHPASSAPGRAAPSAPGHLAPGAAGHPVSSAAVPVPGAPAYLTPLATTPSRDTQDRDEIMDWEIEARRREEDPHGSYCGESGPSDYGS